MSYSLHMLSARLAGGCGGMPCGRTAAFSAARRRLLVSAHAAAAAACASKKAAAARDSAPASMHTLGRLPDSTKTVSLSSPVRFPPRCFSKPNLSVIWMVWTRSMSSRGLVADLGTSNELIIYLSPDINCYYFSKGIVEGFSLVRSSSF